MRVDLDDFERRYAAADDPWGFESLHYEQRKYAITVASLPRQRYTRCFEPGCAIGVLTERLAAVADQVVSMDPSASAVERAKRRVADRDNVDVRVGAIPESWPTGSFDLIVLSEIGYYWDEVELAAIAAQVERALAPTADLLAVHWLGSSPDHLLTGDEVHGVLRNRFGAPSVQHREQDFVLDVWTR